jgi:DNA repair protein SbcC/Rad50
MRLHSLEMHAFGPFAGHERVDLDALTGSGLFLLCGPTGAGKTSVLDAVCFALFGQVPGERDKAKRLHSDHAPATSGPRVVLEVSLRGRRLRITRCPEWVRPKKRGSGEIREHAKVLVEERTDDGWQQRTNRIDEAGDLVGSLLGLSLSQFCQVALLPQGRFETFLRCGAQERHTLLQKLFGTHRFRAVEEWLAEHRRSLAARSADHAERVTGILERVAEASGRPRPEETGAGTVLGWAEDIRLDTEAGLTEATEARAAADQHAKDARVALDAARDIARMQERHREAVRRDAELRALADSTARMAAEVEAARLAAAVQPFLEMHEAARQRAGDAQTALDAARTALPAGDPDTEAATESRLGDVSVVVRRRHDDVARLEALLPLARRVVELDTELERIDTDIVAVDDSRQLLDREHHGQAAALETLHRRHAEAVTAATRAQSLRDRLAYAERVAHAARQVPAARQQREALAQAGKQATDQAQEARERWLDLRQARLEGMAAELARDLADGRACPVCGSAEHPAPAGPRGVTVSPGAEQAAEHDWHQAEEQRHLHTEALARCDREVAALEAAADGTDLLTADMRLSEARNEVAGAERCAAAVDTLAVETEHVRAAAERSARRRQELDAERVQLVERRTLRRQECDDCRATVDAATGDARTLDAQLERAREAAARWERLCDRLREQQEAQRARDHAAARLDAALADAGFAGPDAARDAAMSRTDLSNTETLLRRRADQAAQVRAELDDPRVTEAAAQPECDTRTLAEKLDGLERRRDEAVVAERRLEHQTSRLEALRLDLETALAAWRPVRASLTVAERMASLCAGTSADNRHRMRLSAYVLAARLEQVVAAANERLLAMSSGRYTLRHSVARGVGDRRGGLGLQVHDGWTGDLRDPATLSGGETFYTSLALALGLADVVSHEAGGTEIDTLFVDEGFGSLDPDTLDEVMDVLDQLRSGGRAVGIVSHVADLRSRVPAQVHVRKSRTGSSLAPTAAR